MDSVRKKFLADVMLGRLAKWLRIVGYDTLYFRDMDDDELIRRAIREERTLLTRDRKLYQRGGFHALLITEENLEAQLGQVLKEMDLEPQIKMGIRCPLCNRALKDISRKAVRQYVPPYVWATHDQFSLCPGCGKIFWKGTHWESIKRRLARMGCQLPSVDE
jgi:hypothetical protein